MQAVTNIESAGTETARAGILDREPVLFFGVVQACLACATAFGLDLSGEQVAAVEMLVVAVASFAVRRRVTPVATAGA